MMADPTRRSDPMICATRTLAVMLILCCTLGQASAASLAPARDWRMLPSAWAASSNAEQLGELNWKRSARWSPIGNEAPWLALRLATVRRGAAMLTWQIDAHPERYRAVVETSPGQQGPWRHLKTLEPGRNLRQATVEQGDGPWVRLRLERAKPGDTAAWPELSEIALYELRDGRAHDYWLFVGASIQASAIRQDQFNQFVRARHPRQDPVAFNLAVGGWKTDTLLAALPGFLEEHPHARYVAIHIGGNNVSANRPWPGGADVMERELREIIRLVEASGKIPILARLSYRAYKPKGNAGAVPPEENGSLPYNINVHDPMIAELCPLFYDLQAGRGRVDPYNWLKSHPEQLTPDGVHLTPVGRRHWTRLWAEQAGAVVYRNWN